MIAALALVGALHFEAPHFAASAPRVAPVRGDAEPRRDVSALRASWREAIELDVPGEVLAGGAWIDGDPAADPGLVALYARALHSAGRDERAAALLARGESAPLVLTRARIAIERDEIPRALELLAQRDGSARFPDEPESYLLLGRARTRAGRASEAEPALVEFVKRAPWHVEAPQAWFLLVEAARARGDVAEAARREEARAKSTEWHAFFRTRRVQARASPKEPLPRFGLAQLWLAANELANARRELDAAIALDPRFCRGLELDAEVARRLGEVERARRRSTEALACDPALVDVHLTLARIARDGGDAAESARCLARYRELGGARDP